jgi:DNA-binding response OmpR family regulator
MGRRLVILDDEEDFCAFVARVATDSGYEVFATTRPGEFLRHVRANRVSVIVLDLRIPYTDGVEVLRHLASYASRRRSSSSAAPPIGCSIPLSGSAVSAACAWPAF